MTPTMTVPASRLSSVSWAALMINVGVLCPCWSHMMIIRDSRWTRLTAMIDMQSARMGRSRSLVDCGSWCSAHGDCNTFCFRKGESASLSTCYIQSQSVGSQPYKLPNGTFCFTAVEKCPSRRGYKMLKDQCIRFHLEARNFSAAAETCHREGGHLYYHKSLLDALYYALSAATAIEGGKKGISNDYWMGADDIKSEGTFHWHDGSILPSDFMLWSAGSPSGHQDLNCVLFRNDNWLLQDIDCSAINRFVCEIDIGR